MEQLGPLSLFADATAARPDAEIDVVRAALSLAKSEYADLNIEREIFTFRSMAGDISSRLLDDDDPLYCMNTLSEYLFDHLGFRGNDEDYYDPRNSYLNQVLERRMGIPITLAVVYMELGRRLKIPLVGIGMPGHFLVRHVDVEDLFVDPFHGGIMLSEDECRERLRERVTGALQWDPSLLSPISNQEILDRIIRNLKAIFMNRGDFVRALDVSEFAVSLDPHSPLNRRDRGIAHYQLGNVAKAIDDLRFYLALAPDGPDVGRVRALVAELRDFLDD